MFDMRPIGFMRSPYSETSQIPKGCGAKHDAEGVLEVLPEFEEGLLDIEGFSHLFVIWTFHRSEGFSQIPKGCGAKHDAEGVLEVLPEFEEGLLDIEGFSHLFVIWTFHRSEGFS